jgi:hypothetical protein
MNFGARRVMVIDPQKRKLITVMPSITACGFARTARETRETASGDTARMTWFTRFSEDQ